MTEPFDAIVVGAGLSGLVCATRLQSAGKRVLVLEAAGRVGGRTLSVPLGNATFDLGGQWLGPRQPRVTALARELDVETFPTHSRGRHVFCGADRRTTYRGTIPKISPGGLLGLGLTVAKLEVLTRLVSASEPQNAPLAAALDQRAASSLVGDRIKADGRATFNAAIRTVFGAEAADLSLLFLAGYAAAGEGFFKLIEVEGGAQERRFAPGAQALSLALAAKLTVQLDAPVVRIEQTGTRVVVKTNDAAFEASRVVVAIPPPQIARIDFEPPLPASRRDLLGAYRMGSAIKVHVLYDTTFWRAAGLSGEAVFELGPLSVTFDNTSRNGAQPALVGFIVGDNAKSWRARNAEARRAAVLDNLCAAFGPDAATPSHYLEHDWSAQPFVGGCPVASLPAGALTASNDAIRLPVGRLHWAGTETAVHYTGYLEGAIEAGERAAVEVQAAPA